MAKYWHILMSCLENHPYPLNKCYFCKENLVYLGSIGFYGEDSLGRCANAECEIKNSYHIVNDKDNNLKQISFMMGKYLFSYGRDQVMILLMSGSDYFKIKTGKFQFVTHDNFIKIESRINKFKIFD